MSSKHAPGVVHQSKNIFLPGPKNTGREHDSLPPGTYLVGICPQGFYCEQVDDLKLPKKLYGSTISRAARIVKTFLHRQGNTGVLLTGLKGSGKTLLVKACSRLLLDEGYPTILINQQFTGDAFAQFLSSLNTPFVALMDEFEKVYDAEHQEQLLTLLDGVHSSKGLFMLTANRTHKVDDNFINRPSRIFYNIHYKGMEIEAIRELAMDTLDDRKKVDDIVKLSSLFNNTMNFDMVQSAIEESNSYPDQKMSDLMEIMNLRPDTSGTPSYYTASLQVGGKTYSGECVYPNRPRLSLFGFDDVHFMIRPDFSDEEFAGAKEITAKPAAAAKEVAVGCSLDDLEEALKKSSKKKKFKISTTSRDEKDDPKYDQNRPVLGEDYDDVWDTWSNDFRWGGDRRNIQGFSFSSRQMKGSDHKKQTYSFVSDKGAVLTLSPVAIDDLEARDLYNLL